MKSAYDGMNGFDIENLTRAERARRWAQDCQTVADEWFGGDTSRAEEALDALPYSTIPYWTDLDAICRVILRPGQPSRY